MQDRLLENNHDPHRDVPQTQARTARPGAPAKQAWDEWQKHQTLLINERRLNMMNAEDRKFLQAEMDKFLSGEEYAQADGYVPPSE
jgi:hypothetical protein